MISKLNKGLPDLELSYSLGLQYFIGIVESVVFGIDISDGKISPNRRTEFLIRRNSGQSPK
jgi:hypothetical protein